MNRFKNYIIENNWVDVIFLCIVVILCSLMFSKHWIIIFSDRGREFLLPYEILNGKVPYKDITLIYFPFAYYINAMIYKLFGVSFNSLIFSQTILCSIAMVIYYKITSFFLKRGTSLLLSLLIIVSCIFSSNDLFSYIVPYSWARVYGIFGVWLCIYAFINLFQKEKIKYAYFAAICTGFAMSCKLEFFYMLFLFIFVLFLYKKQSYKTYVKLFLSLSFFPMIEIGILFMQGVSIQEVVDAMSFGFKFAKTPVMIDFLTDAGFYPYKFFTTFKNFIETNLPLIFSILIFCYLGLYGRIKYKTNLLVPFVILSCLYFYYNENMLQCMWDLLAPIVFLFFCINFKNLIKYDKILFILVISSLLLSTREIYSIRLFFYGTYSLPLLLLCLITFIKKYVPQNLGIVKLEHFINLILVVLTILYSNHFFIIKEKYSIPIKTNKGIIYTNKLKNQALSELLYYIDNKIDKNSTILVLPEGNIINFITDRKVDLKCFMMDRLYYDAYGKNDAVEKIKNTKSDYIILVKGFNLSDFNRIYLYTQNSNKLVDYIEDNYKKIKNIRNYSGSIEILKRK